MKFYLEIWNGNLYFIFVYFSLGNCYSLKKKKKNISEKKHLWKLCIKYIWTKYILLRTSYNKEQVDRKIRMETNIFKYISPKNFLTIILH